MVQSLRTLKKLSKRAAALLPLAGDDREQFRAERYENYTGTRISARKHWERSGCHPTYTGWGEQIVRETRAGRKVVLSPPSHPLKGTIMVGAVSGYYEPEWDEETAWDALRSLVYWHFMEYGDGEGKPRPTRTLRTPRQVFQAADDMILQCCVRTA